MCKLLILLNRNLSRHTWDCVSLYSQHLFDVIFQQAENILFFHRVYHWILWHSQVHDMFVFSLSHFLHNRFLKLCCSAEQQTVVYLFSPVKQSVDTNSPSHSHALRLHEIPEPLHWNSSLPSTDSHFFCIVLCACAHYEPLCPAPTHWYCCHNYVKRVSPNSVCILQEE